MKFPIKTETNPIVERHIAKNEMEVVTYVAERIPLILTIPSTLLAIETAKDEFTQLAGEVSNQVLSISNATTNANNSASSALIESSKANASAQNAHISEVNAVNALTSINTSKSIIDQKYTEINQIALTVNSNLVTSNTHANLALDKSTEASTYANSARISADEANASVLSLSGVEASINNSKSTILGYMNTTTNKANLASTYADNALQSKDAAIISANNANTSQIMAYNWAQENENIAVSNLLGIPEYSAYHWAKKAESIVSNFNTGSSDTYEPKNTNIQEHILATNNPHNVTKAQLNMSNVENTLDINKVVLSASKLTTPRNITIGSSTKSFDGSSNTTWTLDDINAQVKGNYQPLDADLTAIASLSGTNGLLKKTAADTWILDTNTYVTSSGVTSVGGTLPIVSSGGNTPTISINTATTTTSGSMSSTDKVKLDSISANANNYAHPTSGVSAGTYKSVTVDTNGHVTGGTNPTTVSGYGLIDVYTKTESNTSLALKVNNSEKGVANGVATLDGSGKVPQAQLPGYLDDVVEYANYAAFPGTGTAGIIYIDISNGKQYRWSGSAYASTGGGAVDSVAGKVGVVTLATSDISGLDTALSNKAASTHTHSTADVTGLQEVLDAKATTSALSTLSTSVGATDTIYVTVFNAALV